MTDQPKKPRSTRAARAKRRLAEGMAAVSKKPALDSMALVSLMHAVGRHAVDEVESFFQTHPPDVTARHTAALVPCLLAITGRGMPQREEPVAKIVGLFLGRGVTVEGNDAARLYIYCCHHGLFSLTAMLVSRGIGLDAEPRGQSLFSYLLLNGATDAARILARAGTNPDAPDTGGETARARVEASGIEGEAQATAREILDLAAERFVVNCAAAARGARASARRSPPKPRF